MPVIKMGRRMGCAWISGVRAELSTTYLRAPFAGIVAEVTGEIGEFTTPSPPGIPTPPAVDLIDDTCLYVTAPMDEIDAPKKRTADRAEETLLFRAALWLERARVDQVDAQLGGGQQ